MQAIDLRGLTRRAQCGMMLPFRRFARDVFFLRRSRRHERNGFCMLFEDVAAFLPEGVKEHCYVATEGARIVYVGEKRPQKEYGECVRGTRRLLLPAFYNCHSHTAMTLLRGYGENLKLQEWLETRIFPFEAKLDEDAIYWASLLGAAEMVRFGIAGTTDMYFHLDEEARAFGESGVKINLSNGTTQFAGPDFDAMRSTRETRRGMQSLDGAYDGKIKVDISLHAEYTSDEALVRRLVEEAARIGAKRMHVHVSETRREHEECKVRRAGRTPARYLNDCGVFDIPATAAHCVWAEPEDLDIFHEKGVIVAHCPKSNLKLASGIFDVPRAWAHGVKVGLGTDSVASNNNLNMLEEMRVFVLTQRCHADDPTTITPEEAVRCATRVGALSQGREDCGEIREGFRADLVLFDMDTPWCTPEHSMLNNLMWSACGTDVMLTMVDGRVVYREGTWPTLDVERVMAETERVKKRILAAL